MASRKTKAAGDEADVRAAVYVRISILTTESTSMESQQRDAEALVRQRGWQYDPKQDLYIDPGQSGSKERVPPDFLRLMKNLDRYDRVVVYSIDRFTRRLGMLADTLDEMKKRGVGLITVKQGIDTSTDQGRTYAEMFGALAAGEARQIGERVKTSQKTMSGVGRYRGGSVCYGWKAVPRSGEVGYRLALEPKEAEVLRRAIARLMDGSGLSQTVRWLNEHRRNLVGREKPWTAQALRKVLTNRLLLGYHVYDGKVWRNEVTGEILVPHEPLLPVDEFEALQQRLAAIAATRSRGTTVGSPSLLAGIARCGRCGGRLHGSGSTYTNRTANYRCRARYDLNQDCIGVSCKALPLDQYVSAWVVQRLSKPAELKRLGRAAAAQKKAASKGRDVRSRIAFLEREMKRLREERHDGRTWSYRGGAEDWREEYGKYADELTLLQDAEEEMHDEMAALPIDFKQWVSAKHVEGWWEAATVPERQALIRAAVKEVVVHPTRSEAVRGRFDPERVEVVPR